MAGVAAGTLKIIGSTHRAMQFMVPTIQYRKMFAYHAKVSTHVVFLFHKLICCDIY